MPLDKLPLLYVYYQVNDHSSLTYSVEEGCTYESLLSFRKIVTVLWRIIDLYRLLVDLNPLTVTWLSSAPCWGGNSTVEVVAEQFPSWKRGYSSLIFRSWAAGYGRRGRLEDLLRAPVDSCYLCDAQHQRASRRPTHQLHLRVLQQGEAGRPLAVSCPIILFLAKGNKKKKLYHHKLFVLSLGMLFFRMRFITRGKERKKNYTSLVKLSRLSIL